MQKFSKFAIFVVWTLLIALVLLYSLHILYNNCSSHLVEVNNKNTFGSMLQLLLVFYSLCKLRFDKFNILPRQIN